MKTRRITELALYIACSLIIYIAESALPALVPIPGVKLGLANIITLLVLVRMSVGDAFLVLIVRIILGSIFAGQATSFMYSLCGGLLSLLVMALINRFLKNRAIFLTSMVGSVFHGVGQLLAAALLTGTTAVFLYLPWLCICGLITGAFTGFCAHFINRFLPRNLMSTKG